LVPRLGAEGGTGPLGSMFRTNGLCFTPVTLVTGKGSFPATLMWAQAETPPGVSGSITLSVGSARLKQL